MANSTLVKLDYTFEVERGSTWGTAIASLPQGLPVDNLDIKQDSVEHEFPRAYGIRGTSEDNYFIEDSLSIPTGKISACPVTPSLLLILMPGVFQKSGSWTASPANVYSEYPVDWSLQPDFRSNEGYFYTLSRVSPAGLNLRINSAVPHTAKFSLDVKDNNSVLMSDWDFIGKGYVTTGATASAAHLPLTNLYKFSSLVSASFDSVSIKNHFIGFEAEIKNNAKFVNDLPSGAIVLPKYEVSGKIKMMGGSAQAELMKGYAQNSNQSTGRPFKVQWGANTPTALGDLQLNFFVYLTDWTSTYDEGEVIEFSFVGCFGDTGALEYPAYIKFFAS